jgi:hypothetical protein
MNSLPERCGQPLCEDFEAGDPCGVAEEEGCENKDEKEICCLGKPRIEHWVCGKTPLQEEEGFSTHG